MGHPGLIYRDGFQYAYASFYAITIPFTGVMFLKRQWMLGKRFGFVTPGEMLATYFQGDGIRLLVVLVALLFSIPYLGLQLRASGFLFNVLTDNLLSVEVGMWVLSAVVFVYVASGGLRAVAYVDTVQCLMLAFGIVAIGKQEPVQLLQRERELCLCYRHRLLMGLGYHPPAAPPAPTRPREKALSETGKHKSCTHTYLPSSSAGMGA